MVQKNVSPQKTQSHLESFHDLRRDVLHLIVDCNVAINYSKLAATLSVRMGKKVSRNSLSMALSGYRTSAPYVEYLRELQRYLRECIIIQKAATIKLPVTFYTNAPEKQAKKEELHGTI